MTSADQNDAFTVLPRGIFRPKDGDISLKVGVIGGGIAGLACAIALIEDGHEVEIFEKSSFSREVGAGIHCTPNVSKFLQYYDFDTKLAQAGELREIAFLDATTGQITKAMPYPDMRKAFGAPWYCFHRVDLHNGLRKLALEPTDSSVSPAKLVLQTSVTNVETDGTIHFKDGSNVKKDVIVVANGIHSEFAEKVAGRQIVNTSPGFAMLRFLIPMEKLLADPKIAHFYEGHPNRFMHCEIDERILVSYPCRDGTLANCGFFHRDTYTWEENAAQQPASKEHLLSLVQDFSPVLRAIIEKAEDISVWRLEHRRDPVRRLVDGKLIMVGDAAHPMLPFLGQGGAMAMEDGFVLGPVLSSIKDKSELQGRLELFNKLRSDRVCAIQLLSNWALDGMETVLKQADPYLPHLDKKLTSREDINQWNFAINSQKHALNELQKYLQEQKSTA